LSRSLTIYAGYSFPLVGATSRVLVKISSDTAAYQMLRCS
jgi:hypothetical protein